MKAWLRKTAGAVQSDPINYRHWRELVDEFDFQIEYAASQETEEAVVDLWLEDPKSFMQGLEASPEGGVQPSAIRRIKTGGTGLQRYNPMAKAASVSAWDQEFTDAKNHADEVLRKLGNTVRG